MSIANGVVGMFHGSSGWIPIRIKKMIVRTMTWRAGSAGAGRGRDA